ncbi:MULTISPECIES: DUF4230 domain-containing protein [Olivibacter]|jgi:hypothetical protein|uniref:DUF4230 domain-containing protein n=2 Tax=Olivibacter TaxID=376469 RepID=A0ABV6HJ05_9SPHI|nr:MULTISPECIES: DUF4230 domain-containing protein [Olivibacter]MCL4638880.1 DUF4230 domain-containing protein [Olivibacter sp. UJ_SKK_5.1]MDM8174899.1 DUF4230 domain-containing protein [Olivibacter sp. 47]MDX3913422.1 DUF4230 domain-containing protein [Pseudosphingobacterium sp.]QEL01683.1 DUF4230 domain-containing protein [Olivibacter sp. LS-1]
MLRKTISTIVILLLIAVLLVSGWFIYYKFDLGPSKVQVADDVMVERITDIGKLELVKYSMKDVLERKELRYFFPDQRVLFIAVGEVAGCIDLRKVKKEDIIRNGSDSVTIYLPEPEICYVRLDHKRSKVYDISGAWLPGDTQNLVEGIYQLAEQRLLKNAQEMNVLGKTKENASIIFKPMIENITGAKINIAFR